MRRKLSHATLAMIIYGLSGCASVPATRVALEEHSSPQVVEASEHTEVESASFEPDLLFRLLTAEIAGYSGNLGISLREYKRAAFETRDPQVVERAMRIASYAKDDPRELLKLARLWVEVSPEAPEPRQAIAMLLIQSGEVEEGVSEFKHLLSQQVEFNYMSVVTLLSRQPDGELSLKVMALLTEDQADNAAAQFAYAHLAARVNNQELALEKVDQALNIKPDWVDAVTLRGHLLQSLQRNEEAIAYLAEKLKGEFAENDNLRLNYARALLRNEQFDLASEQLAILTEHLPEDGGILYMWASTSMQLEQFDRAEELFKRLLVMPGREQDARFQLGRLAEIREQNVAALEWYRSVTEGQYLFAAQLQVATLLAREERFDESLAQLDSIKLRSVDEQLNLALIKGEVLYHAKRYQQAVDHYGEHLSGELAGNEKLLYGRSLAAEKMQLWEQSEADLRAILEQDPDSSLALNALGYSLADRSVRLEEALGYIKKAMDIKPNDPAITDSMGWVLYRMGDYQGAVEHLRKALELFYDAEISAHLGEVLWVRGDRDEALKVWNTGLEKSPNHEMLIDTMKRFGQ